MVSQKAIQVKNLSKSFQEHEVIRDCSMTIQEGTIFGLLGVNGVGKTTLFKPLNGLDPVGIKQMRELFLNLVKECHMTILLSSHIVSEIEHVADMVGSMAEGKILHQFHLQQMKEQQQGSLEDYFFTLITGGQQPC